MTILTVGTGAGDYTTLAAALAASQNGDTINVAAGVYTNQTATITDNVTIQGVGGTAYFVATQPVPNAMGILVVNAPGNVTLQNIALSGATTSNANGANAAGIRYQSGNLTLVNTSLSGNQNGILATPLVAGTGNIVIRNSTVTNNGVSDPTLTAGYGSTHNLYVNDVASLTISGSTITAANVGHEVKSRAQSTSVTNSIIAEGPAGTASYSIDLPNGGVGTIQGNTIQQGPLSQNPAIISNGEEGNLHTGALAVSGNTIINNDPSGNSVAVVNQSTTPASVTGNLIAGLSAGQIDHNAADTVSGNTLTSSAPVIGLKVLNDGATLATASATANTATATTSGAGYSALTGIGIPGLSLQIAATGIGGHTASFMLSQPGFTASDAVASFFDTNIGLAGAKITWSVYANADNALYGMATLLGSWDFTDFGGQLISASSAFALPFLASVPYSLTELVTIVPGGAGPGRAGSDAGAGTHELRAARRLRRCHGPRPAAPREAARSEVGRAGPPPTPRAPRPPRGRRPGPRPPRPAPAFPAGSGRWPACSADGTAQPDGGSIGLGTSPPTGVRARPTIARSGIASSSSRV